MSDIDLPPLPELGRPFYGPDVQEYALSAIAPYKAEIERLKDQFHRMTMAHATECKKAEKAESECERLKALCVGCLDIYYVVDPPFPADAMRNYLEENGINLEHYTYKRDQP